MIVETEGNLLRAPADALVNTVNTEGVMGKGIALQFKRAYPTMFRAYSEAAKLGKVRLGEMHVWPTQALTGPRYIINFPTKGHWRARSRVRDIESGLEDLVRVIQALDIESVAVPPLGCGNGGLNWDDVRPRIYRAFEKVTEVDVLLYPPVGAPRASEMINRTDAPDMTPGRAALVGLLARYARHTLDPPSLIETQKLMYFLQEAGEDLRLRFEAHLYGPYADNLRHVLTRVEGHFLVGFGDGSAPVLDGLPLSPIPRATEAANEYLAAHPSTTRRMVRVLQLADGFESSYGLELLATVHWVVRHESSPTDEATYERVSSWSERKARMYTPDHVRLALSTLREQGWLPTDAVGARG